MESKSRAAQRPTISAKRSLSKNLSEMKFMKRKDTDERDSQSSQWMIPAAFNCHPAEQWVLPFHFRPKVQPSCGVRKGPRMVQGYAQIMGINPLLQGITLNGFNREMEKLTKLAAEWKEEDEGDDESDGLIPAVEATARYLSDMKDSLPSKRSTSKSKLSETLVEEDEGTIPALEVAARYQTLMGNGEHSKRGPFSPPPTCPKPKRRHFQKP